MGIPLNIRISSVLLLLCQLIATPLSATSEPVAVAVPEHFPPHYSLDEDGSLDGGIEVHPRRRTREGERIVGRRVVARRGVEAREVDLRAERAGAGNGRVYHIEFEADDSFGGVCIGSVTVCVPHDKRGGAGCIDDGQSYSSTAQ